MEQDQRLTALPRSGEIRATPAEYPPAYSSYFDEDGSEGKRTLQQYISVVYKRLPIILAIVVLATAATAFYMYRQPTQYQSTLELLIEPRKPRVTSKDSININFGNDLNYYNTQIQLLSNPGLMRDVIVELGLHRQPDLFGNRSGRVGSLFGSLFGSSNESEASAATLPIISEQPITAKDEKHKPLTPEEEARASNYASQFSLAASQKDRTNLVIVNVRSIHRDLNPIVANKAAELFQRKDADREQEGARRAVADLQASIEELQAAINNDEAELIQKQKEFNLPLAEKGQDLAASRLGSLSETWLKAMESRRQLESRYNAAVAANARGEGANMPDLYENKIYQDTVRLNTERRAKLQDDIRNLDKQLQELEAKRQADSTKYTDEHPVMKALIAQIESIRETRARTEKEVSETIARDEAKIKKDAVSGALVALRSQLEAKRREEAQAQAAYDREAALANIQGQNQTQLTSLRQRIETNRNLLGTLSQRLQEGLLAINTEAPNNIKTVREAEGAGAIGPARGRNIIVAMIVAFAAGIGLAFLLDYLDDSVKTSEDVGRHLGLPTLALIPHYFGNEKRRLRLSSGNGNGNGAGTGLVTLEERHSPMAEAYRHLRTSLLFSSAGKPPQTILITSSQPSEGKTTTAINTAITLAQSDADVIIVDCDLRRPRIHSHFGLDNTQGLTNYLSGERKTENLIKAYPGLPRLKVITSGPIPPNPAELLSSNEMKNLLQFLRGKYKHIIIDSPPAISFTDAAILATVVDGVVLVAMAGKSSMHLIRRFKQRLANMGARIYGVVLNGIKAGSMEYEYYGSGYYDYYRKAEDDPTTPVMEDAGTFNRPNG
ncbi:polysaccharide biosynthesis tyrosine autokinase [Leptolyngbya sp. 7M]|uniref:polysaccharide biosynthesis tyrosine autokinase n=1 Tax=Leptolyngbya sp. 7M TaxID=2812896 RepID=UPI001B8BD8B1|nr:polysaccharide biosynthesis tyrosine autokinase [Leptolyngbya sp. 7M]QYO66674.1 polysaccharide biosynthesis tyrosine autokinase [Leptolyngbya sp. 7M]